MLEARRISPSGLTADATPRLLAWLLAHGADELTVAVMALRDEPGPVADAFEDALAPFELPVAPRRMPGTDAAAALARDVRRWALTADSLAALLPFLSHGLFEPHVGPSGWLEDLAIRRRGELVLGVVTHEREAVLRLTAAEHAEVQSLGVSSSAIGTTIDD
jgi:hypothetical protein